MKEKIFWITLFILTAACPPLALLLFILILIFAK